MATEMVLIPKSTYERLHTIVKRDTQDTVTSNEPDNNINGDKDTPNTKRPSSNDDIDNSDGVGDQKRLKPDTISSLLIEQFPESYRFYAKRLLGYIRKNGDSVLGWDDNNNTLLYRDNSVEGSNIVDLINHLFKTNSPKPKGNDMFMKGMVEVKVPKGYMKPYILKPPRISNKIKKSWLKY